MGRYGPLCDHKFINHYDSKSSVMCILNILLKINGLKHDVPLLLYTWNLSNPDLLLSNIVLSVKLAKLINGNVIVGVSLFEQLDPIWQRFGGP